MTQTTFSVWGAFTWNQIANDTFTQLSLSTPWLMTDTPAIFSWSADTPPAVTFGVWGPFAWNQLLGDTFAQLSQSTWFKTETPTVLSWQ